MLAPRDPKIVITVGDVKGPAGCRVCGEMIDDYRGKLILARNKQADVIICGGCIARGGEEIDEMLRERA